MVTHIINKDSIWLKSNNLKSLFDQEKVENFALTVYKNCCDAISSKTCLTFCKPIEGCRYRLRYCLADPTFISETNANPCNITIVVSHVCGTGMTIQGIKSGTNGNPVPGCDLNLWVNGVEYNTITDSQGKYSVFIAEVKNGMYNIQVNCCDDKYNRVTYTVTDCVDYQAGVPFPTECSHVTYQTVSKVIILVDGVENNVISKPYNIVSIDSRKKLEKDIQKWLVGQCTGGTVTISEIIEEDEDRCYVIDIDGVSNNIVPKRLELESTNPSCFSNPEFFCIQREDVSLCEGNETQDAGCKKFNIQLPFPVGTFRLKRIELFNEECDSQLIQFNDGLNDYIEIQNAAGEYFGEFSLIDNQIYSFFNPIIGTTDVTVDHDFVNGKYILNINHPPDGILIKTLYYEDAETGTLKQIEFSCSDSYNGLSDCIWQVALESYDECGTINFGYLTEKTVGTNVPEVKSQGSFPLIEENDQLLIDAIKSQSGESSVSVERKNGVKDNSLVVVSIKRNTYRPYSIITFGSNGSVYNNYFSCENMYHICGDDKTVDFLSFTEEGIVIFPGYLGLNEFGSGVYSFVIEFTTTDCETITEKYCLFYGDEELKCKISDAIIKNNKTSAHEYYDALVLSNDCEDCDCTKLCSIYKLLLTELNYKDTNEFSEC